MSCEGIVVNYDRINSHERFVVAVLDTDHVYIDFDTGCRKRSGTLLNFLEMVHFAYVGAVHYLVVSLEKSCWYLCQS